MPRPKDSKVFVIFEEPELLKYKGSGHKVEGTGKVLSRD